MGTVSGFEFEAETQTILRYEIRTGSFLVPGKALVHRNQIVSISAEKMIVEDGSVSVRSLGKALAMQPAPESPSTLTYTKMHNSDDT